MSRRNAALGGGFTFVELLVTLAIMGVLALMTVPMAQVALQRKKERDLRMALIQIRAALDAYKHAAEQGRIRLRIGDSGYPHALDELADGVVDQRSPTGQKLYFLRRLPADPMQEDSSRPADTWGTRSYASAPDTDATGSDVFDIYSRSGRIGLNGVPYRKW